MIISANSFDAESAAGAAATASAGVEFSQVSASDLYRNSKAVGGYARAFRRGERVGTAHVESTVNQLINWRFCKKQQMAWTKAGAQALLHVKTAVLNGALHRYTRHTELGAAAA